MIYKFCIEIDKKSIDLSFNGKLACITRISFLFALNKHLNIGFPLTFWLRIRFLKIVEHIANQSVILISPIINHQIFKPQFLNIDSPLEKEIVLFEKDLDIENNQR